MTNNRTYLTIKSNGENAENVENAENAENAYGDDDDAAAAAGCGENQKSKQTRKTPTKLSIKCDHLC